MIKKIEKVFSEVMGRDDLNFTEDTELAESFEFTSLSFVQLICAIEDEFDVEIPNTAIKNLKTVGDVIEFLEKTHR